MRELFIFPTTGDPKFSKSILAQPGELAVPLSDDFIKVDIYEFGSRYSSSEYHMYPLRKPPPQPGPLFQKFDPSKSKYNVLMVMMDSVSHACAQRYIKTTYRYLQENPSTVIMQVCKNLKIHLKSFQQFVL